MRFSLPNKNHLCFFRFLSVPSGFFTLARLLLLPEGIRLPTLAQAHSPQERRNTRRYPPVEPGGLLLEETWVFPDSPAIFHVDGRVALLEYPVVQKGVLVKAILEIGSRMECSSLVLVLVFLGTPKTWVFVWFPVKPQARLSAFSPTSPG